MEKDAQDILNEIKESGKLKLRSNPFYLAGFS